MTIENQPTDASGGNPDQTPAAPVTPTPQVKEPKVEIKDGATFLDGKKVVPESDLIAAKKGLESQLETAQATHNQAIDAIRVELSAEQQKAADLNAQLKQAQENAQGKGVASDDEVTRIKTERDEALAKVETLTADAASALEHRRALLVLKYNVPADSLADKDMKALDSFEEALKALSTSRGGSPGNYAVGGAGGGAEPLSAMERATKIIENTPVRGVRNAEPAAK